MRNCAESIDKNLEFFRDLEELSAGSKFMFWVLIAACVLLALVIRMSKIDVNERRLHPVYGKLRIAFLRALQFLLI